MHEPVTRSRQGAAIPIKATVDPGFGAKKVVLSFSADGADDFAEREMTEDPTGSGSWTADIPASATHGRSGRLLHRSDGGRRQGRGRQGLGRQDDEDRDAGPERPAGASAKKKPAEKPEPDEEESPWFIGLGIGSGIGWTTGKGEVTDQDVIKPAGFSPSQLMHIAPEVGYFVSPTLLISVQLRLQLVTGGSSFYGSAQSGCGSDGVCSPAWNAVAGFGRVSYFLDEGDFRPYVAGDLPASARSATSRSSRASRSAA